MEKGKIPKFSGVSCALPGAFPPTVIYKELSNLQFRSSSSGYDGELIPFPQFAIVGSY